MIKNTFLLLVSILLLSCIEMPNTYTKLPPGKWRGILKLTDPEQIEDIAVLGEEKAIIDYFELPFNIEVAYKGEEMQVYLINGEEKIRVEHAHLGRDLSTAKDTLRLDLSSYDTYMDGFYEENTIEGYWVVNYKKNYKIPYIINYGQSHRFINQPVAQTLDFGGEWKVVFDHDRDPYPGKAEFVQEGNKLSGTFLTETGDYRYLDGNAYGDKLRLSVFDGAHAFLFTGTLDQDTIYGEFRSGKHYKENWYAVKDPTFSLKDPNMMTRATTDGPIDFSYPDTEGQQVSLTDPAYDGKVKLVNIMGTWCPNCRDETKYLKELTAQPAYKDLAVMSLAFERYKDPSKVTEVLKRYKKNLNIEWPMLVGGYANKKENSEALSFIDKLYSYPTLLIIDKSNKIRKIHTGFSGPATSAYPAFKKEMAKTLTALLDE